MWRYFTNIQAINDTTANHIINNKEY